MLSSNHMMEQESHDNALAAVALGFGEVDLHLIQTSLERLVVLVLHFQLVPRILRRLVLPIQRVPVLDGLF